jgi:drug/metabolite transporter (DMT)-like permease
MFAICVLTWGTTWHAITYQLAANTPEIGVALRFALAGGAVLAWCAWRGESLRFGAAAHGLFALQGCFLYGVSYVCVYHAERHLPSGLVAVGYSASPLLAGLGARWLFGVGVSRRFLVGGVLGLVGVALMFWPEFERAAGSATVALGVALTVASVLLSAVGSLAASRNAARGLPLWPALGWGMVYGAASAALLAAAQGQVPVLPPQPAWWLSLLYLSFAGSVLTFACFLSLQHRIGPGPTGAIGVMTPLLALAVSMAFERYRPDGLTALGAVLAVLGNAMMTRRSQVT